MSAPLDISTALRTLKSGGLVGMPTETVYGLAANASDPKAVAQIYALKNRPSFNPLIAHVSSLEMALAQAEFSDIACQLANTFWPGPLTLVLPITSTNTVSDLARAGLDTQALRWPRHDIAERLISAFGAPLVAPSANKSGRISPTQASHVRDEFGDDLPHILDGGASVLGLESTVIAVMGDEVTLLRTGSTPRADIEKVVGHAIAIATEDNDAPKSPGMLSRHYAPEARLRLNVETPEDDEAMLGFGPMPATLNLSPKGDLTEAAANLYAMLRALDADHKKIAVAPIPVHGLGEAIHDRLNRASLGKENTQ